MISDDKQVDKHVVLVDIVDTNRDGKGIPETMNSIVVSLIIFSSILVAALVGVAFRRLLPEHYLGPDAKEVVRLSTGLISTMFALVIGMLVSSAKTSYDADKNEVAEMSSEIVNIDRLLAKYGPESGEIRTEFRQMVAAGVDRIWPSQTSRQSELRPGDKGEILFDKLELLAPRSDAQAALKAQAMSMVTNVRRTQWLMFLRSKENGVQIPLLVVLISWLAAIFMSFVLFAPTSPTVLVTLALVALVVSSAFFIILEMYTPFNGVLRISPTPILEARGRWDVETHIANQGWNMVPPARTKTNALGTTSKQYAVRERWN